MSGDCVDGPEYDHVVDRETCDTAKKDKDVEIDPRIEHHILASKSLRTGKIEAPDNPSFQQDIDHILNLNTPSLQDARKSALDGLIDGLSRRLGHRNWTRKKLQNELARLQSKQPLPPFMGVLEYRLKKLIERHS